MSRGLDEFGVLTWATGDMLISHGNGPYLELLELNDVLMQEKESLQQEKIELQMTVKATEYVPLYMH
jgi:carbamate kinase